jgi:cob(I)alamin adenosyltransferase
VLTATGKLPDALVELGPTLLRLQRDLFVAGAELAANPDAWDRLVDGQTRVDEPMLQFVEELLAKAEEDVEMPREFTVPGADRLSAALELARSVARRAERRVISLQREGQVPGAWLVPWLNRLADLLWVYARLVEQAGLGATVTVRT